jgi:hypothetical protein
MTKTFRALLGATSALCLLALGGAAHAAVTAQQAAQLKTSLTPLGAERAGNADGSIPAWTGGYTTVPPGFKSGDVLPDVYGADKPILIITAANAAQYQDKLPAGIMTLFHKYPDYRVEVYPTHRSAAAPQYVYDNTFENATRASGENDDLTVTGAYGGIPFPIPQSGRQVMWNSELRWLGYSVRINGGQYMRTASGDLVESSLTIADLLYPYYDPNGSVATFKGIEQYLEATIYDPPYNSGQANLRIYPLDQYDHSVEVYEYLTGQRRVRKAPSLTYDTPNFFSSGIGQFDEFRGFDGALDRYTFTIVGKKEMYIPYNCNKWADTAQSQKMLTHYANPDAVRWELHRVWVIDAKLAPGKRNVVAERHIYVDEDTWAVVASDEYDAQGNDWRLILELPMVVPDLPGTLTIAGLIYDFQVGDYADNFDIDSSSRPQYQTVPMATSNFTPAGLASAGVE